MEYIFYFSLFFSFYYNFISHSTFIELVNEHCNNDETKTYLSKIAFYMQIPIILVSFVFAIFLFLPVILDKNGYKRSIKSAQKKMVIKAIKEYENEKSN